MNFLADEVKIVLYNVFDDFVKRTSKTKSEKLTECLMDTLNLCGIELKTTLSKRFKPLITRHRNRRSTITIRIFCTFSVVIN